MEGLFVFIDYFMNSLSLYLRKLYTHITDSGQRKWMKRRKKKEKKKKQRTRIRNRRNSLLSSLMIIVQEHTFFKYIYWVYLIWKCSSFYIIITYFFSFSPSFNESLFCMKIVYDQMVLIIDFIRKMDEHTIVAISHYNHYIWWMYIFINRYWLSLNHLPIRRPVSFNDNE